MLRFAFNLARYFSLIFLLLGLPTDLYSEPLEPGYTVKRLLSPGESHSFELSLVPGETVRLDVEQLGIDIEWTVETPSGKRFSIDSPFDRRGVETAWIEAEDEGIYRLLLTSREALSAEGSYHLTVYNVRRDSPAGIYAWTMTRAGEAYRTGTPESRQLALKLYLQAAEAASNPSEQARAHYAAMVLRRLLNDNTAALAGSDRALELWHAAEDPLFVAYTWNEIGLSRWLLGDSKAARDAFEQAASGHHAQEDAFGEAVAASNLCLMDLVEHQLREGLECYRLALPKLEAAKATLLAGDARTNVGRVYDLLGEASLAREQYEQVLELKRQLGDIKGEARTLNNLGALYRQEGNFDRALSTYDRSLDLFRQLEDRRWQARLLGNIGFTYFVLGEPRRARARLAEAVGLWRQLQDPRGLAMALKNLSEIETELGQLDDALRHQQESLVHFRELEDLHGQAMSLSQLGQIQWARQDLDRASDTFEASLALLRQIDAAETLAWVAGRAGALALELGRPEEARSQLLEALGSARATEHGYAEAQILYAMARSAQRLGDLEKALTEVRDSVAVIDRLRTRIGPADLRASFSSLRHESYELWADLMMEKHQREPEKNWDSEALKVIDRARARTLVELLRESQVGLGAASPELNEELRKAEFRLQTKIDRSLQNPRGREEREALAKERDEALREVEQLEAEIRRKNPETADLLGYELLAVQELLDVLPPKTLVLYYALGEERSFLWRIGRGTVKSFVLPARRHIEDLARRFHHLASKFEVSDRREQNELAESLGRTLFGPLGNEPEIERLMVVADGALHYIPFAALKISLSGEKVSLHEHYQVTFLPSLATLVAMREGGLIRPNAPLPVAIFADPMFHQRGEPIAENGGRSPFRDSIERFFEPLPASRREAEDIAALTEGRGSLIAIGADASRERILQEDLQKFRIVHLATHGVIDAREPTLSGLALAQRDHHGHPVPGFLSLRDIYDLRLTADLVVLSGCRTALGREMRGEGLMGLVRGFMYAGARQVLASLWRIEDQATAEFMGRFYRSMWRDGQTPSAALQQTQLEMSQTRRYRDPAYWSGFVLVGEESKDE